MKRLGLFAGVLLVSFSGCGKTETTIIEKCYSSGIEVPCISLTGKDDNQTMKGLRIKKTPYQNLKSATVRIDGEKPRGSGFLIDGEGHIVTNNHVIVGQSRLTVDIQDKDGKLDATIGASVVGTAECADLAVIRSL